MKKILTLAVLAFAMFIGTGSVTAQNKIEINATASEKAEELRKFIKFDSDLKEEVYQAYKEFGEGHANLMKAEIKSDKAVEKLQNRLVTNMEAILNAQQFERYKTYLEENEE